ncbi:MAG: 50S ribosomal protein L21 [Bryobacterales bacterium]|nr:50S ribosomal protein L21 [Bryobacteraceae bacterium]MDW8129805.1 50S ribosomal protein L21 [Bryobacterales bacterium]
MYAVIETGGKQYRVAPGQSIEVERLPGEPGSEVELNRVLAISPRPGVLLTGEELQGAAVRAVIEAHLRGKKIRVFKFKRKKQYKRTIGHRQELTRLKVTGIVTPVEAGPSEQSPVEEEQHGE